VVSVLQDGTRAYVANFGDNVTCPSFGGITPALPPRSGCGTVSVVNLTTNTVTATIPVAGHPTFITSTQGTPTGKVYVTSTETSLMTVLRTDLDTVQTYIDLQGAGGQVRVTAP
jgi:YVTN family beta-propeller protein